VDGAISWTEYYDGCGEHGVLVKPGDMLLSCSANPDESVGVFEWDGPDGWLGQNALKVTPVSGVNEKYLYYLLRWLRPRLAEVAAQKRLNGQGRVRPEDLKGMEVNLPEIGEQEDIVAVLEPIQEKIKLNHKMNNTLEAMTELFFQDWFIDFGPTRAKMGGKKAYLADSIWGHFPGRLDALGKPQAWESIPLDQAVEFRGGSRFQKYPVRMADGALPVIGGAELRKGITTGTCWAHNADPGGNRVAKGDFLIAWNGDQTAKFWAGSMGLLGENLSSVTSKRYPGWFYGTWIQIKLKELKSKTWGSTRATNLMRRQKLMAGKMICPPPNQVEQMGEVIQPLIEKKMANESETRTLAEIRDVLLPRLMSEGIPSRWEDQVLREAQ